MALKPPWGWRAIGQGVLCPLWGVGDEANIAQSVEHFLGKEEVVSSILIVDSSFDDGLFVTLTGEN